MRTHTAFCLTAFVSLAGCGQSVGDRVGTSASDYSTSPLTAYSALPTGTIALGTQPFAATGTILLEQCIDDDCDETRYATVSTSAPSWVQCSLSGSNPGTLQATCYVALAFASGGNIELAGDPALITEPVQGPATATVDDSGEFSMALGYVWLTGSLGSGPSLTVSVDGSLSNGSTTGSGQSALAFQTPTPLPSGSYAQTCSGCAVLSGQLGGDFGSQLICASCAGAQQNWQILSLGLPCNDNIANCQGSLTCGACPLGSP